MFRKWSFNFLLICTLRTILHAQVPQYTPDQVLSMVDSEIRRTLRFPPAGPIKSDPPIWLSLTWVGLEVPPDDPKAVDLLAVVCPPASQDLATFSSAHRLDQVYETVLKFCSTARQAIKIEGVEEARAKIIDPVTKSRTPEYVSYRKFQEDYEDARQLFENAQTAGKTAEANRYNRKLTDINRDWQIEGFKTYISTNLDKIDSNDAIASESNTTWRREVLNAYKRVAEPGAGSTTGGSLAVPRSFLHPAPDKWNSEIGWFHFGFSKTNSWGREDEHTRTENRYGSGSGGFLFWKAGASGSSSSEHRDYSKIEKASGVAFEFELRRAIIDRPWFDQRFLFEPGFWTWLRPERTVATEKPPLISQGNSNGFPIDNSASKYTDYRIPIPILPSEVIVARNLKMSATVSESDFAKIDEQSKSSASGSGRLFFFFKMGGGGSSTSTLKETSRSAGMVSFELSTKGPVVVGFISQVVPRIPDAKKDRVWSANAWLNE